MSAAGLGWAGILRLGLVQTALGAVIVLTTSTLNRVMVVEFALPAMLPGILIVLKDVLQLSRPRFGHGSDVGGRRTPWIAGGMLVLALGGLLAAVGTAMMGDSPTTGFAVAVFAFLLIGLGVGAAGTNLLVLLARRVAAERRAAAAATVWIMMIAGFAITAGLAGHFLDPFSPERLVAVSASVSAIALFVTLLALRGIEDAPGLAEAAAPPTGTPARMPFRVAFAEVWRESESRRFTVFVFISMLAYSAQDLILEPFAGRVFAMSPGESTRLAGLQHTGVLIGMLLVAAAGGLAGRGSARAGLRAWTVGGCVASALALAGIALGAFFPEHWPLRATVFALGLGNGVFAVSAIASMMALAGQGQARREGLRMGLWGAAQAIAMGAGAFGGTVAVDLARWLLPDAGLAYALVFGLEGLLFMVAALLGATIVVRDEGGAPVRAPRFRDVALVEVLDAR